MHEGFIGFRLPLSERNAVIENARKSKARISDIMRQAVTLFLAAQESEQSDAGKEDE